MVYEDLIKTTYSSEDVVILLKDISGNMKAMDTAERERQIQNGVHYSEMLPLEYKPTEEYIKIYNKSLEDMSHKTALGIAALAERLVDKHNGKFVIISLARAGIPIGILVKRYIEATYKMKIPHYSISIIRGKGIDTNAMEYIKELHKDDIGIKHFQFLDGWTGKGAINNQLTEAVDKLKKKDTEWKTLDSSLAVLADPANICELCGTHSDFLIPSACLNGTVSGLISRTILRDDLINITKGDFHGAVYFKELEKEDRSIEFIDKVITYFNSLNRNSITDEIENSKHISHDTGINIVLGLAKEFNIPDINLIKPGVGETTRVLLRRIPWKVLIDTSHDDTEGLEHIIRLCREKNIPIEEHKLGSYKACGIIKDLSADA